MFAQVLKFDHKFSYILVSRLVLLTGLGFVVLALFETCYAVLWFVQCLHRFGSLITGFLTFWLAGWDFCSLKLLGPFYV